MHAHIHYAFRMLRKNPGFSATVILTLALGIAANTAVFTVTDAVILRPLPYKQPDRLVLLDATRKAQGTSNGFTLNRYELIRDHARSLSGVAVAANDSLNLSGIGDPQQVPVARSSGNFFNLLGIAPQLGRLFNDADARPEASGVIVLSNHCWRTIFGGDPHALGRTVYLDSRPYMVIGVLPASSQFPFLSASELWLPRYDELSLFTPERLRTGVGYLTAVARLAPNYSLASASAEMRVLDREYTERNPKAPDAGSQIETRVTSLEDSSTADLRPRLLLLSAAVALVLLIACGNAANLLLWRAAARTREVAIRTALGADARTIMLQFLSESLGLALIAGIVGIGLSVLIVRAIVHFGPAQIASANPSLDWRVLLFVSILSILTGFVFGFAPGWHMSRADLQASLRTEGTWGTASREQSRLRSALLIGQVTFSLMLLVGTGLLVRSFIRLAHTEMGFDPDRLLTASVSLPAAKYATPERQVTFFRELVQKLEQTPGIRSAAVSSALPPMKVRITPVLPEGQPKVPLAQRPFVVIEMVSPGWFETMRVPLRWGRAFSDSDVASAPKVLIANEAFANRFWPNENPIGKHVEVGRQMASEIVGVAQNVKNDGLTAEPEPELYIPYAQLPWSSMNLVIRTAVEPHSLIPVVRKEVLAADPEQPISAATTGEELMESSRSERLYTMLLLGIFSVTAISLALLGLYSVLSYSVVQRRRELAIRIALGGTNRTVSYSIVREGLVLVGIGIGAGLLLSILMSRLMAGMLYQVSRFDPLSFLFAVILFLVTSAFAAYLPARRVSNISPWEALR